MGKVRVIAFYLPQFYPTPENDEWWEPGFTEWTNVARAKPLFRGHNQPRIPRDLGFYDLRVPETREKQAQLAREAGIEGFCYWHYWFGNGKRLLANVFREVVETGKPDFPFCLCWANHSWYQKTWDPNKPNKLLIEQTYPGVNDYEAHFYEMLPAFKDKRYMRTSDGRLIFGIFSAFSIPNPQVFFNTWNQLAKENGLMGFDFFAFVQGEKELVKTDTTIYDRIVYDALDDTFGSNSIGLLKRIGHKFKLIFGFPIKKAKYIDYTKVAISMFLKYKGFTPCIVPMFDHSPRSKNRSIILHNDNPELWGKLCKKTKEIVENDSDVEKLIFIKSWNEWGECNYMEPDTKFGKKYIEQSASSFQ